MTLFPNRDELRRQFLSAQPFPFVKIDNFLDPSFARQVASAYPTFELALARGKTFTAVNERRKVQITDSNSFAKPIAQLNSMLASEEFLKDLSYITNIPKLLADDELVGGGMHITGPGGRLDVHVDFNFIEQRKLHRRLNLLLYLNPDWDDSWGGNIQLWDQEVTNCVASFAPKLNRCVIFETSEISYHGVLPVAATAAHPRISFATYYYTKEAPAHWDGKAHSTIFRARPEEKFRKFVLMPAEKAQQVAVASARKLKKASKDWSPADPN
jgi:Rps23 Pro-64 3,4-dihydroxylase Tpa1-like proline 4-hydroxylase